MHGEVDCGLVVCALVYINNPEFSPERQSLFSLKTSVSLIHSAQLIFDGEVLLVNTYNGALMTHIWVVCTCYISACRTPVQEFWLHGSYI